ncbi:M16 family metallopeptidase [Maricaulis parjimensis]|uniref:M16 family metallopeptidase n=1 Tax=Maricaulis parjimensis TaxID=144023 RepID=UPI00193971E6|nr:pitrilysin family protein [Maricaulis parjimensis]
MLLSLKRFARVASRVACFAAVLGTGLVLSQPAHADTPSLDIPIHYETLDNGLRVVLSPDSTVPTVSVGLYFGIGFRSEPPGRTGYAHLFEHLYFAGAELRGDIPFDAIISETGGSSAAFTRFDFTRYVSTVPSNALDMILWAEADRMSGPLLTRRHINSHRNGVRNEIFLNVENQPYQGWPLIDLPMTAFVNWHNAHNFYGDLSDLDAATAEDAREFFRQYYTPNNAVLVVAGDFDLETTRTRIADWFGPIPQGPALPELDVSEPEQTAERRRDLTYPNATQPGVAVGYHMPPRGTPEYYAMMLIDMILISGDDARMQRVAADQGYGNRVSGSINALGNAYDYNGPMLWEYNIIHPDTVSSDDVLAMLDGEIARLREELVSPEEIARARAKRLVEFYISIDNPSERDGIVDLLASFALFDDDPTRINRIEEGIEHVTPELIRETARTYLRPERRSVVMAIPGSSAEAGE